MKLGVLIIFLNINLILGSALPIFNWQESNQFEFKQEANPFDYAYAITCHKAQGDQFGNVIVYEQRCDNWDHVRWSYTAASRAVNGLIWVKSTEFHPSYLLS